MQVTNAQLRSILAGIEKVIQGPGFGTVEVVIEKHRVVRIRTTVDERIDRPEADGSVGPSVGQDRPQRSVGEGRASAGH